MLALIDYGSGNIRSVENALKHEGLTSNLSLIQRGWDRLKA
jgi:imidazoleglycerol phosphate synthase glutamine amidotransferase subunit HisH